MPQCEIGQSSEVEVEDGFAINKGRNVPPVGSNIDREG